MKLESIRRPTERRMSRRTIERIAKRVRAAAENELVWTKRRDPLVRGRVDLPHDLRNGCAIVSYVLAKVLQSEDAPALFVIGEYATRFFEGRTSKTGRSCLHCWVELYGYVIDLTATQFGQSPIVIMTRDDPAYRAYHEIHATGSDAIAFVNRKWKTSPRRAPAAIARMLTEVL